MGSLTFRKGIWDISIRKLLVEMGIPEDQAVRATNKIRRLFQKELATLYINRCKQAHDASCSILRNGWSALEAQESEQDPEAPEADE